MLNIVIPLALHRMIVRLGIHREIETAVGVGLTMLAGMGLVALSMVVMLRVTPEADPLAREDLAFALSVLLLGLLVGRAARWSVVTWVLAALASIVPLASVVFLRWAERSGALVAADAPVAA